MGLQSQTVASLLDKVKDSDSVSYRREEAGTIWSKGKSPAAEDCAKQVRKLQMEELAQGQRYSVEVAHTWKSVFILRLVL